MWEYVWYRQHRTANSKPARTKAQEAAELAKLQSKAGVWRRKAGLFACVLQLLCLCAQVRCLQAMLWATKLPAICGGSLQQAVAFEMKCTQTAGVLDLVMRAPLQVTAVQVTSVLILSKHSRPALQEADQLSSVARLLGTYIDRLIVWCCVNGGLQGAAQQALRLLRPHSICRLLTGLVACR